MTIKIADHITMRELFSWVSKGCIFEMRGNTGFITADSAFMINEINDANNRTKKTHQVSPNYLDVRDSRIKDLERVLEKARLLLESWNLQSGDKETLRLIGECNKLLQN